jgi:hypothetical protein
MGRSRSLFLLLDPVALDRFTNRKRPRRRKLPLVVIRSLDLMQRALQALPPRELTMLFQVKVLKLQQDEAADLHHIRQSNVSYRLERAVYRIRLHHQIADLCSETTLYLTLCRLNVSPATIRIMLGYAKTSAQSGTAQALGLTQSQVRETVERTTTLLANYTKAHPDDADAVAASRLLVLIAANANQLRSPDPQSRYRWKVGNSLRTTSGQSRPASR